MGLRLMAGLAAVLFVSCAAEAGVADQLTAAIRHCAAITDDTARHACYDQLPSLLPPPGTEAPAAETKASPSDSDSSGGFSLFGSTPVPADHITATVESFSYDFGVFVVTLDNGQVWRQVASKGDLVGLSKDRKDKVTIWRDSFGNFVLKVGNNRTVYHVRRIQ